MDSSLCVLADDSEWVWVCARDVHVGDIVKVRVRCNSITEREMVVEKKVQLVVPVVRFEVIGFFVKYVLESCEHSVVEHVDTPILVKRKVV